MKWLLPHRFKSLGLLLAPGGFLLWISFQLGLGSSSRALPVEVRQIALILAFFAFLFGIYCITFSREKMEDEMVQRTRLDSFQFAAIIQLLFIIVGFLVFLIVGEPRPEGMMLFFIALIVLFWLSFIVRFNYIIHVKYRHEEYR